MTDSILKSFTIIDGKIIDPQYEHDFHIFHEDNILIIKLVLPGIIPESILIRTEGEILTCKAFIDTEYRAIYKSTQIEITGKLPEPVLKNSLVTSYDKGILSIELVPSSN